MFAKASSRSQALRCSRGPDPRPVIVSVCAGAVQGRSLAEMAIGGIELIAYENARVVRRAVVPLSDGGELLLHLLHGEGTQRGRKCIHRVVSDAGGRLKSDIVYFYDETVSEQTVSDDFDLLTQPALLSVSQLHHTESMLNRKIRAMR